MAGGANTVEVQKLLNRGRARLVRATMEVLETEAFPAMTDDEIARVTRVVKAEINLFTGSMRNLVDQVVDESMTMSPEVLRILTEMVSERDRS